MAKENMVDLGGYSVPARAEAVIAVGNGKVVLGEANLPARAYNKSNSSGIRPWVAVRPKFVGFCPTDTHVAHEKFPGYPGQEYLDYIVGHEAVGTIEDIPSEAEAYLASKGIRRGTLVAVDINNGDGTCYECKRGKSASDCDNIFFIGLGTPTESARASLFRETGQTMIPGAYNRHLLIAPVTAVYKVPKQLQGDEKTEALATQFDVVACAIAGNELIGLGTNTEHQRYTPNILVIGAGGRFGNWTTRLIKNRDMAGREYHLFLADVNSDSLGRIAKEVGVLETNRYLIPKDLKNPYSPENLAREIPAFERGMRFDAVFDTVGIFRGEGANNAGESFEDFRTHAMARNGRFSTPAFGIDGTVNVGRIRNANSLTAITLSPRFYVADALQFLAEHGASFSPSMTRIGGLEEALAHHVETGGKDLPRTEGSIFYSDMRN